MNSSEKAHGEHIRSNRKPYMKPEVQIYGDVREITQAVGKSGALDSGSGNTKQTGA